MEQQKQLTIRDEIQNLAPQIKAALPPHITVERFIRIVMTAISSDPDLARADRRSLFEATMKCAQDGLLPDKREAAFVVFNTNAGKKVQYIPMVGGLLKKIRNSGELGSITAHVVFENDEFHYALGDDEKISHKPLMKGARGAPILAYAIAHTRDGSVYREIMTREEIDAVRNFSKAQNGPWAGPFFLEMWKKTVLRRLSKRLPMSTDLPQEVSQIDDEATDVTPPDKESVAVARLRTALTEYCERNGGGTPTAILRDIIGRDDFAELTDYEAARAHRDFESQYPNTECAME